MLNKFKIGDRVKSINTGPPMTGEIVAIVCPKEEFKRYQERGLSPEKESFTWNQFYPTWTNESVYYVKRDILDRPVSFDEWKKSAPDVPTYKRYQKIEKVAFTAYPERDLKKI